MVLDRTGPVQIFKVLGPYPGTFRAGPFELLTVTRRMSRQFNLSLHVKINHIESEKIFDKINENVRNFC